MDEINYIGTIEKDFQHPFIMVKALLDDNHTYTNWKALQITTLKNLSTHLLLPPQLALHNDLL